MMEYQSNPIIEKGLKVRTNSYSFEKETQAIRNNLQDAFSVFGKPTRQDVYKRWDDLIKYAKTKVMIIWNTQQKVPIQVFYSQKKWQ